MNPTTTEKQPEAKPAAKENHVKKFVKFLVKLANSDNDRARLAALRKGLSESDARSLAMMPVVGSFLGDREQPSDRWYFVVAALFASHPLHTERRGSFGASFRRLRPESESMEKRFQTLLASDEDELFRHLVQAVALLKSHNVPVNWTEVLSDLVYKDWNDPEKTIQMKWAREFYGTARSANTQETTPENVG